MLLVRKVVSAFLVPPGLFIFLLLAALFLMWKRKRTSAGVLIWAVLILQLVLSSFIGEYLLVRPLEESFSPLTLEQAGEIRSDGKKTAIIVLAGGVVRSFRSRGMAEAEVGEATLKRLFGGFWVYKNTGFPICLSGGVGPGDSGKPLAETMGEVLEGIGVPPKKLIYESSSQTTWENAVYSVELLKSKGFERIVLVTDAVHMQRSVEAFRAQGIEIIPHPSGYLYERPGLTEWLPNSGSLNDNLRAVHEWVGLLFYRIRY